jgi:DNA polymerase III delta prime subunit
MATLNTALPWVEKYRPKTLHDLMQPPFVLNVLQSIVQQQSSQHLLLYGPAGVGKTSAVLAICKELFRGQPELLKSRVLELNASSDRGIDAVRNKIKTFAQSRPSAAAAVLPQSTSTSTSTSGDKLNRNSGSTTSSAANAAYPIPSFKIIILDEADSMTPDAQFALRRIMEEYAATTRFCIMCNYVSRIITPLLSRCIRLQFRPVDYSSIVFRLQYIAQQERIAVNANEADAFWRKLIAFGAGDLRTSVSLLQTVSDSFPQGNSLKQNDNTGTTATGYTEELTYNKLCTVLDTIPEDYCDGVWLQLVQCLPSATLCIAVTQLADRILREAYPIQQVLCKLASYFFTSPLLFPGNLCVISTAMRSQIVLYLSECELHCVEGGNEAIQFTHCLLEIAHCLLPLVAKPVTK